MKKEVIKNAVRRFKGIAQDGDVIVSMPIPGKLYMPWMLYAFSRIQNHQRKLKVFDKECATFGVSDWFNATHVEHYFEQVEATFSMEPVKGRFIPLEKVAVKNMYIVRYTGGLSKRSHDDALKYAVRFLNGQLYDIGQLMMIDLHRRLNRGVNKYEMFFLDFGAEKKVCSVAETLLWRNGYGKNIFRNWADDLIPPCLFLEYDHSFKIIAQMRDGKIIRRFS